MDLKDPCGGEPGLESLVGIYIGFLQYGVNYTNKGTKATCRYDSQPSHSSSCMYI